MARAVRRALILGGAAAYLLAAGTAPSARADSLVLPSATLARDHVARIVYRLAAPRIGRGILRLEWTDAAGNVIERRKTTITLDRQTDIPFDLDPQRALVMRNFVTARVELGTHDAVAAASFVVTPRKPDWSDYQLIMWQPQSAAGFRALRTIGVDNAKMQVDRAVPGRLAAAEFDPLIDADTRPYVENIATDFYAAYHRWRPDRPVNWRFVEVQALYAKNPNDPAAFIRDPSLSDPIWLKTIGDRLRATVAAFRPYRPLFYNLADEAGIADLNAFWDFDLSAPSLSAMRIWLQGRYGTLAALNHEWGSQFSRWDDVMPMTTAAALRRTDGNFAAWADFKSWMDVAFADAVAAGRDAVHGADPDALAGLEGAQKPRWGGYNYARLARAVDVMEVASEPLILNVVHSLNPRLHLLTTSTLAGPAEEATVWRALLQGSGGLVIWDSDQQVVRADGLLGPRGDAAAPYLRELRDGIGALVINNRAAPAPVALLYSPASLRIQWLLDRQSKGDAWAQRGAEDEWNEDGAVRAAMDAGGRSLERLGFEPCYLSPEMIAHGALGRGGYRALILTHAIALSAEDTRAIREFVLRGGALIADTAPGLFDEHGRRLDGAPLAALFQASGPSAAARAHARYVSLAPSDDGKAGAGATTDHALGDALISLGIAPGVRMLDEAGATPRDVAAHVLRDGEVTILALQRDFSDAAAAHPEALTLRLPRFAYVYDIRRTQSLGRIRELHLELDAVSPAMLAISPAPLPRPVLAVPHLAHPGERVRLRLGLAGPSRAATHVFHVAVTDPAGRAVIPFCGNFVTRTGAAVIEIALPQNASAGRWTVRMRDLLSGQRDAATFLVENREKAR